MKIRRFQVLDEDQQWLDEAYAYEKPDGQVGFRYNVLTWGRVGASINQKIEQQGIQLESIETIVPPDDETRWLDIEDIEGQPGEIKAALDEVCQFPKPRSIAHKLDYTVAA